MENFMCFKVVFAALATISFLHSEPCCGYQYRWVAGEGNWSIPSNWDAVEVPGCSYSTAIVGNGGMAIITSNACSEDLYVMYNSSVSVTSTGSYTGILLSVQTSSATISGLVNVFALGVSQSGSLTISSPDPCNMSGGIVHANETYSDSSSISVGGSLDTSVLSSSGGAVDIPGTAYIDSLSILSGGDLAVSGSAYCDALRVTASNAGISGLLNANGSVVLQDANGLDISGEVYASTLNAYTSHVNISGVLDLQSALRCSDSNLSLGGSIYASDASFLSASSVSMISGLLDVNTLNVAYGACITQTDGNVTTLSFDIDGDYFDTPSRYDLQGGEISITHSSRVGFLLGSAVFSQSGGVFSAGPDLSIGTVSDSGGLSSYLLNNGHLSAGLLSIGNGGNGVLLQTGGIVDVTELTLRGLFGSKGSYSISEGSLFADRVFIGYPGQGIFAQAGGHVGVEEDVIIAQEPSSSGTCDINDGVLQANRVFVGIGGVGNFNQRGGIVAVGGDVVIGLQPDSNGTYEMSGGLLNVVGDIDIGREGGAGSLVVDNGTINGVIYGPLDGSALCVYPSGSLTGPGTYNILVEYRSAKIYGTHHNNNVAVVFEPNCLTNAGECSIEQIAPIEFADGNVSNLLESSVFEVKFEGEHCGEFTIAIPYDEAEVDALDANEVSLVILHETPDDKYEVLDDIFVDTLDDYVAGKTQTFGKFAVMARRIYVLSVGVGDSGSKIKQDVQAQRVRNAFAGFPAVTRAEWKGLLDTGSMNGALLINEVGKAAKELSDEDIFIMYIGTHGFFEGGYDERLVWAQYYDQNGVEQHRWSSEDEHMYLSKVNLADNISDDTFSALFMDAPWPKVNKLFIIDTCYAGGFWGDVTGLDSGDLGRLERAALIPAAPEPNVAGTCLLPDRDVYVGKLGNAVIDALAHAPHGHYSLSLEELVSLLRHYGESYVCGPSPITDFGGNWDVAVETDFIIEPRSTFDFSFKLPVRRSLLEGDLDDDGDVDLGDFGLFANHWSTKDCEWPDWCKGTDIAPIGRDGIVNMLDLTVIAEHWLEGIAP